MRIVTLIFLPFLCLANISCAQLEGPYINTCEEDYVVLYRDTIAEQSALISRSGKIQYVYANRGKIYDYYEGVLESSEVEIIFALLLNKDFLSLKDSYRYSPPPSMTFEPYRITVGIHSTAVTKFVTADSQVWPQLLTKIDNFFTSIEKKSTPPVGHFIKFRSSEGKVKKTDNEIRKNSIVNFSFVCPDIFIPISEDKFQKILKSKQFVKDMKYLKYWDGGGYYLLKVYVTSS